MSIRDSKLISMTEADVGSASVGSVIAGSTMDIGVARDFYDATLSNNPNEGGGLIITVRVEGEKLAGAASAAGTLKLLSKSTDASWTTGTTLVMSKEVDKTTVASSAAPDGTILWKAQLGREENYSRYLKVTWTTVDGNMSAGKLGAWISLDSDTETAQKIL